MNRQLRARHLAFLTDRVRTGEGEPQVYGCVHVGDGTGGLVPWPIEHPENVDARRAAAGLPPMVNNTQRLKKEVQFDMQRQDERKTVEGFLAPHTPEVRDLMLSARALIMDVMPKAVEAVRPGRNAITYATSDKMADWILYIAPFKSRINIGFLRGTELPDPRGLMEGTGKLLRHVKINSKSDLEAPALRALIEAAVANQAAPSQ